MTQQSVATHRPYNIWSWAALSGPFAALALPIYIFIVPFYAEQIGIPLAVTANIIFLCRCFDVITDPIMGSIVDTYPSKRGNFRHWAGLSVPIALIICMLMFFPPQSIVVQGDDYWFASIYLFAILIITFTSTTMFSISHMSWGSALEESYDERSKLFIFREVIQLIGTLAILTTPVIVELNGYGAWERTYSMGILLLITFPICAMLTLKNPDVKIKGINTSKTSVLFQFWKDRPKGKPIRLFLITTLLFEIGIGVSAAPYVWVASHYVKASSPSLFLLLYFIGGFVTLPLWLKLSYRFEKHKFYASLLFVSSLTVFIPIFFLKPNDIVLFSFFTIVYGAFSLAIGGTLLRSICGDLVDVVQLEKGQTSGGKLFSYYSFVSKIGAASGTWIALQMLAVIGFDPTVENSESTEYSLLVVWCGLATIAYFSSAVVCYFYPLTRTQFSEVRTKLDKLRSRSVE